MDKYKVENPKLFFAELGGAHDSRITNFSWNKISKILTIGIDDLNSNFLDLPEYKGVRPVTLVFAGVSSFDMDIQFINDQLNIYDIEVDVISESYMFNITCSPGGCFKCECKDVQISEHELLVNQPARAD